MLFIKLISDISLSFFGIVFLSPALLLIIVIIKISSKGPAIYSYNIFGPEGTWDGGKEKAPAAMCRKAALAENGESIEDWGDGKQTRSFLYIDECKEAVRRLMKSVLRGQLTLVRKK